MKSNKRLKQSLNRFSNKKQNKEEIYSGELGIPQNGRKIVEVPNRAGYVYARLLTNKNELIQALNTSVAAIYGLPVQIRRVKNTYTIIGKEYTRYSNQGSGVGGGVIPLPRHGGQHSLNPDLNMGSDPTWVYSRQIMHMLAYPSGTTSMMLGFSPGFYQYNNQWVYPQVTGVPSFASYVPTVTGTARMALYYLDGADNGLKISAGALFSGGISDPQVLAAYIPTPPTSAIPLMAVKLRTGTISLDWSNLYDARPWLQILPTGSTGGTVLNIQDEGVPLGTATTLNFMGSPVSVTVSGTVANIFITGSSGGNINPPVTGSVVIWDDGITQGSALHLNFGNNITATISGSTAQIDVSPVAPISVNGFLAQDEGIILGTGTTLNFVGGGVTASISGSVVNVNVPGGGGGSSNALSFQDEGIFIGSGSVVNFVGGGVTATASGTVIQVNVPSGSTGTSQYPYQTMEFFHVFKLVSGTFTFDATVLTSQLYNVFFTQSVANNNDAMQTTITLESGTYDVSVLGRTASNRPIVDWSMDGTNFITGQDWYAASPGANVIKTGTVVIATGGRHILKFAVNGKNASSSAYALALTAIWFVRQ